MVVFWFMVGFSLFLIAVGRAYIFDLPQNSIKYFHDFQFLAEYPALNSPSQIYNKVILKYLRLKIPLAGKK